MDKLDFTSPFFKFTPEVWATFAHSSNRLNLTEEELKHCLAFNDRITLDDVRSIYLPLSRLLYLYERSRHNRARVITQFLGKDIEASPFIISIFFFLSCSVYRKHARIPCLFSFFYCSLNAVMFSSFSVKS